MENRATQGGSIPRHVKTHYIYQEYTELECDEEWKRLTDCLSSTQYKKGGTLHESCVPLIESLKHSCGLRRPTNVTRILPRGAIQRTAM